jgi:endonuclease/exonuclease/phosphatase family metal-dependent hydrolase
MWRNKTQKPAEGGDKPDVDAGRVAMEAPAPFRVATYNIRCPIDKGANAWPNRVERVRALIKKHGFDLIGLQEATSGQIDDLLSDEWAYVGVGRDDGKRGGEASCIFYKKDRFEVRETDTFWLSETPSVPGSKSWATDCTRICTWARMADRKTGRDFYFFNTHLDHRSEVARENGMSLILTRMTRIAQGRPVLLAGDMNATPGTEPIARASAVLHEAYKLTQKPHVGPVATSNGFKFDRVPTAKIDHIFVSDGVKVLTHATYDDSENGLYPSDHFPVAADVVVE